MNKNELVELFKSENNTIWVESTVVGEKFGKSHNHVIRDIKKILESNSNMKNHFIESTYKNTRGREYINYKLDEVAFNILCTKYQYSSMNPRFEIKFGNLLNQMFPHEKIISQYCILNYKIDFFMPDIYMIIEYDEDQHKYQKESDAIRMKNILKELNRMVVEGEPLYEGANDEPNPHLDGKNIFSVVRIEKGKEIDGLRKLCIEMTEHTMNPCSIYME